MYLVNLYVYMWVLAAGITNWLDCPRRRLPGLGVIIVTIFVAIDAQGAFNKVSLGGCLFISIFNIKGELHL